MAASGQPVYEVEGDIRRVAAVLGYPHCEVNAAPTMVMVSLSPGEAAAIQSVRTTLRLDQIADVNAIRRDLLLGRTTPGAALNRLAALDARPPRFGRWGLWVGLPLVAPGICIIIQPGIANILATFVLSFLMVGLMRLSSRTRTLAVLLPPVTAFLVSLVILLAWQHGLLEGPLRTIICPLAILLPGATLATGMAELAVGMMVAGTSRLIYGAVRLLLFTVGVLGATTVLGTDPGSLSNVRVAEFAPWAPIVGLLMIAVGMVLSESLPLRYAPYALVILTITFLIQLAANRWLQPGAAASAAAATAAFGASVLEATHPNVPRLVTFLPSFWLLVPGTLGLMSVTEIAGHGSATGVLNVLTLIIGIALGLLFGSSLARPLYGLARHDNPVAEVGQPS